MDELREDINKVIALCEKNNKSLFYGDLKAEKELLRETVNWTGALYPGERLDGFIFAFIKSNSTILIVTGKENNIELSSEVLNEYLEIHEPDNISPIQQSYNSIRIKQKQIVYYRLAFFDNKVYYEFKKIAEWKKDYDAIKTISNNLLRDIETEKRLSSKKRQMEIARKIISDKTYLATADKYERDEIVENLAKKAGVKSADESWSISFLVEKLYNTEVKKKMEEELKNKIQELKGKGYTKVKIMGELGISKTTLDKLYY